MTMLETPPAVPQVEPPSRTSPIPPSAPPAGPLPPAQRIALLDVLRGFALFGILLVNMAMFSHSFVAQVMGPSSAGSPPDMLARWLIAFFAEGKFYSTFAFLFGLGMALQCRRFAAKNTRFAPFFLRRMSVLLLIGLAHAYLFWVGDILILYSVLGVVLLAFRNRRPRTLLVWTAVLLLIPMLLNTALFSLVFIARATPEGAAMVDQALAEQQTQLQAAAAQANQIYATGSFLAITAQRAAEMRLVFATWPFMAFNVLAMMVLGVYAGQQGLMHIDAARLPWLHRVWRWSLAVGVIGNLLYVSAGELSSRSDPTPQLLAALVGQTVGAPALSIFYMTSIALLMERQAWRARLAPLASVGRMAISNYLLQTIICTTLFYGYGFGLYGRVGAAAGVALTVAIYAAQVPLSVWWLRRYRFGPVEWLWRTLSYGRRQPMRRAA